MLKFLVAGALEPTTALRLVRLMLAKGALSSLAAFPEAVPPLAMAAASGCKEVRACNHYNHVIPVSRQLVWRACRHATCALIGQLRQQASGPSLLDLCMACSQSLLC